MPPQRPVGRLPASCVCAIDVVRPFRVSSGLSGALRALTK